MQDCLSWAEVIIILSPRTMTELGWKCNLSNTSFYNKHHLQTNVTQTDYWTKCDCVFLLAASVWQEESDIYTAIQPDPWNWWTQVRFYTIDKGQFMRWMFVLISQSSSSSHVVSGDEWGQLIVGRGVRVNIFRYPIQKMEMMVFLSGEITVVRHLVDANPHVHTPWNKGPFKKGIFT